MISRAGESFPYFIQDKEVADKIGFKPFLFYLNSSCFLSVLKSCMKLTRRKT